jgi:dTDP-4-amino-4,6-dideoxygalactose transaminase
LCGDIGLFSFGPAKHLYTVQGGVIATNSVELYEKLRAYRDREMPCLPTTLLVKRWMRFLLNFIPFERAFRNAVLPGLRQAIHGVVGPDRDPDNADSTPTLVARDYATAYAGFQARVGLSQLRKLDDMLERRQKLTEFYDRELRDIPGLIPAPIIPGANYSHYTMRVTRRDEIGFRQHMQTRGVEVGQVYDHVLPFRERFRPYASDRYPDTEQATREVVNLPLHPRLKMSEAQYVADCARLILQQFG